MRRMFARLSSSEWKAKLRPKLEARIEVLKARNHDERRLARHSRVCFSLFFPFSLSERMIQIETKD